MARLKTMVICLLALAAAGPIASAADKPVRVLLFADAATHEYQFVQGLLVRDQAKGGVDVSAFLQPPVGRDKPDEGVRQDAKLLDKFPDLLEDKRLEGTVNSYALSSYDVIVAFDPDWLRLSEDQAKLLKQWVEKGGGLVVVAGPVNTGALSRKANADKLQAILDLYPVIIHDVRLDSIDRTSDAQFPLRFPSADKSPAFLNLDPQAKGKLAAWDDFFYGTHGDEKNPEVKRGFYDAYPVDSIKAGATVWATFGDPMEKTSTGGEVPFAAEQTVGKGRVIYLGSGELWRLRACREAYYDRFWNGLISYAAQTPAPKESTPKQAPPDKETDAKPSPDKLSMEVDALRLLYAFDFTAEQRADLEKRAKETMEPARKRKTSKVSDDYYQALSELHDALAAASDDDAIDAKEDALDAIEEKESPELDDDVKLTDAARKQAGEVLHGLKASQLTTFVDRQDLEEAPDPKELLVKALPEVRGLKRDEWKEKREEIAEEVSQALAGADADKAEKVSDRVVALLSRTHAMSEKDFSAKKADLEKIANDIAGGAGPDEVLKNRAEHALAELLSNPRLAEALKAQAK
ncbi:MAG TPA: hypothetical protein VMS17_00790 [Gemmataceae bacterium]|nr:hypothetical protein [Gemmataceae bacterium]